MKPLPMKQKYQPMKQRLKLIFSIVLAFGKAATTSIRNPSALRHGGIINNDTLRYQYASFCFEHSDPFFRRLCEFYSCECCGVRCHSLRRSKFCSHACRYASVYKKVKPTQKACVSCGQSFTPARSDAKCCSGKCRTALSRQQQPPQPQCRTKEITSELSSEV